MAPDTEQAVFNVLKHSNMFTDAQIAMAVVMLDPVVTTIENDLQAALEAERSSQAALAALQKSVEENNAGAVPTVALGKDELSPVNITPFMTVIPTRRPKNKLHTSRAQARGAISYQIPWSSGARVDMELHEFIDGKWVLIEDVPKGTKYQDLSWRKGK